MRLAMGIVLCLFFLTANAATMGFEGVVGDNDALYDVLTHVEGDYRLAQTYDHCWEFDYGCSDVINRDTAIVGRDALNPYGNPSNDNGSAAFTWTEFNAGYTELNFARIDSANFNLGSIDYATSEQGESATLRLLGYSDEPGAYDSVPQASARLTVTDTWNTHVFDSSWNNVNFVIITYGLADVQLDNISATVVPVPAAVWLFGSALAGLGWMIRRNCVCFRHG